MFSVRRRPSSDGRKGRGPRLQTRLVGSQTPTEKSRALAQKADVMAKTPKRMYTREESRASFDKIYEKEQRQRDFDRGNELRRERGLPETPVTHVDRSVKFRDLPPPKPSKRQARLDELTAQVFYDQKHPLNRVLTREFGVQDVAHAGSKRWSGTKADVRAQLIALEKKGKIPSFGPESPQEREARIKHLLKDTRVRPPRKRM